MGLPGYQDDAELLKKTWGINFERKYTNGYSGHDPYRDPTKMDESGTHRWGQIYNIFIPYATLTPFPNPIYVSADDITRSSDLSAVLNEYVSIECAKFITGQRSLNNAEIDAFYSELDAINIQEFEDIYVKAYEPHR